MEALRALFLLSAVVPFMGNEIFELGERVDDGDFVSFLQTKAVVLAAEITDSSEHSVSVEQEIEGNAGCKDWCYSKKHKETEWVGEKQQWMSTSTDMFKCNWVDCALCPECPSDSQSPAPAPTTTTAPVGCGPYNALMNSDGNKCCPISCGVCGGTGCSKRPGGKAMCCNGAIPDDVLCSTTQSAPCTLAVDVNTL